MLTWLFLVFGILCNKNMAVVLSWKWKGWLSQLKGFTLTLNLLGHQFQNHKVTSFHFENAFRYTTWYSKMIYPLVGVAYTHSCLRNYRLLVCIMGDIVEGGMILDAYHLTLWNKMHTFLFCLCKFLSRKYAQIGYSWGSSLIPF